MITLNKISETATKITLGWTPVPNSLGYVFYADDERVSNTWDPNRSTVTFAKGPAEYKVVAVGAEDEGVYPPSTPTPTGTLKWRPPGYTSGDPTKAAAFPGYTPYTIDRVGTHSLDNGKDYYLELGSIAFSGRNRLIINGGRNVVLVGGQLDYTNSSSDDGDASLQIDGGDARGIVHLEGLRINNLPNGLTLRTPRIVQVENCHIKVAIYQDNFGMGHPDVIQVWRGHRSAGIRVHRLTAYSEFTFLCDFTDEQAPYSGDQTPTWELHDVDLHGKKSLNNWMGNPQKASWSGSNCWLETSTDPTGTRRDLGDQLRQFGEQYNPKHAGYEIWRGGTKMYTQQPGVASGAPGDYGRIQGDELRYLQVPQHPGLSLVWRCQTPPGGEFVPAATVGANYVSPGYQ